MRFLRALRSNSLQPLYSGNLATVIQVNAQSSVVTLLAPYVDLCALPRRSERFVPLAQLHLAL